MASDNRGGALTRLLLPLARRIMVRASAAQQETGSTYEAGARTRRTLGWNASTTTPNAGLLYNLTTLRDRSRAAARNNGYGAGAIDDLVSNIIGTGIKPLSQAPLDLEVPDPLARAGKKPEMMPFRQAVQMLWERWTDESDADGLLDWYGQQAQAVRGWLEGGEVFIRIRPRMKSDGLSVPMQIQVIEPEMCPHTFHSAGLSNGNIIRAGIEFNGIGKRVAYWFYQTRPGDSDFYYGQLGFKPLLSDSVIHLFMPERAGQIRGTPRLTRALILLHEVDKTNDAVVLKHQLSNMFVAFLKRNPQGSTSSEVDPLTGLDPLTDHQGAQLAALEAGTIQELYPDEDITFSDPPQARGYNEFIKQQLYHISRAVGVPYEILSGDMSNVNDRSVRVILSEFRRRVQQMQHQVVAFQVCRRVWSAWINQAFKSGVLAIPDTYQQNREPWERVKWMPQGWPYLHPVQDIDAQQMAVRAGFTTRSAVVSEQGEDATQIDLEQASDNTRADVLKLKYDSDARVPENAVAKPVGSGQGTT